MAEKTTPAAAIRLERAAPALSWLAIAIAVATFAWLASRLGRGLEMTDESFYLLSAIHAVNVRIFFTPTHWVGGALWQLSQSLFAFRTIGLGLSVVSALLLAWGVLRAAPLAGIELTRGRVARAAMLATTASGAMLYGSLMAFTPSYNLLGAGGACLATALALLSIAAPSPLHGRLFASVAGIALGITVLCKFSTGVGTAGLLVVLQLAFLWRQPSRRVDPLLMVTCAASTVAVAVLLETGFAEALRQFRAGVEIVWFVQGDKTTLGRLARSATDMFGLLGGVLLSFWGPLLCIAVGMRWRPLLLGCVGAAWFATLLMRGDYLAAGMAHYAIQALPIAAALGLSLLAAHRVWTAGVRAVVLTGVLAALPVAVALGTWNPLQIQILTAMAPWGALIGLLAFACPRPCLPAVLVSLLFSTAVAVQVINNGADPYRMRPAGEQVEAALIGQLGTVKVDARTALMVREVQLAASRCNVQPGAPFLDFYNLPGVALVLDAVPVESPWLLDPAFAALALKRADPAVLRKAVIAVKLEPGGARPAPPSQLPEFPQGFRLCGRATGPWDGLPIELWAPG